MSLQLPTDPDTNFIFERAADELTVAFGYSLEQASNLVRDYYTRFRDPQYCAALGIPTQDDDFFHHQAPIGMALRIHYYLGLKGDPDPGEFLAWRAKYELQRVFASVALKVARQFARQDYAAIIAGCAKSNLTSADLERFARSCAGTLAQPPDNAYDHLATLQVEDERRRSWLLRVPLWTLEKGQSELIVVLKVSLNGLRREVALEGLTHSDSTS